MIGMDVILVWLANFSINTISALGYFGILFLMALESMIFPLPSELVMPFAGFLVSKGSFSFLTVLIVSTFGSLIGSLISYYIGKYLGIGFIKKFGKYVLLDEEDLEKTENWFAKGGEKTIFISRFIPVVRHFISIPAGVAKMNIEKFCIYTFIGAGIWNGFLLWLGYILGVHWQEVRNYSEYLTIVVTILLVLAVIYFVYKHIVKKLN